MNDSTRSTPEARMKHDAAAQPGGDRRLMLAAIVAGVAFVVLFNIQSVIEGKRLKDSLTQAALITTDLRAGATLSATNCRPVQIQRSVMDTASGLQPFDEIELGVTVVERNVAQNDLLRRSDLVEPIAADDALTGRLRPGRQVVALSVNRREPSAFLRSGSRVDVYGAPQGAGRMLLIIENLEVLSIDGEIDEDDATSIRSIEVHVPAELVERIKEVQRRCPEPLSISVRRPGDVTMKFPYDPHRPELGGAIATPVQELLTRPYGGSRGQRDTVFDDLPS